MSMGTVHVAVGNPYENQTERNHPEGDIGSLQQIDGTTSGTTTKAPQTLFTIGNDTPVPEEKEPNQLQSTVEGSPDPMEAEQSKHELLSPVTTCQHTMRCTLTGETGSLREHATDIHNMGVREASPQITTQSERGTAGTTSTSLERVPVCTKAAHTEASTADVTEKKSVEDSNLTHSRHEVHQVSDTSIPEEDGDMHGGNAEEENKSQLESTTVDHHRRVTTMVNGSQQWSKETTDAKANAMNSHKHILAERAQENSEKAPHKGIDTTQVSAVTSDDGVKELTREEYPSELLDTEDDIPVMSQQASLEGLPPCGTNKSELPALRNQRSDTPKVSTWIHDGIHTFQTPDQDLNPDQDPDKSSSQLTVSGCEVPHQLYQQWGEGDPRVTRSADTRGTSTVEPSRLPQDTTKTIIGDDEVRRHTRPHRTISPETSDETWGDETPRAPCTNGDSAVEDSPARLPQHVNGEEGRAEYQTAEPQGERVYLIRSSDIADQPEPKTRTLDHNDDIAAIVRQAYQSDAHVEPHRMEYMRGSAEAESMDVESKSHTANTEQTAEGGNLRSRVTPSTPDTATHLAAEHTEGGPPIDETRRPSATSTRSRGDRKPKIKAAVTASEAEGGTGAPQKTRHGSLNRSAGTRHRGASKRNKSTAHTERRGPKQATARLPQGRRGHSASHKRAGRRIAERRANATYLAHLNMMAMLRGYDGPRLTRESDVHETWYAAFGINPPPWHTLHQEAAARSLEANVTLPKTHCDDIPAKSVRIEVDTHHENEDEGGVHEVTALPSMPDVSITANIATSTATEVNAHTIIAIGNVRDDYLDDTAVKTPESGRLELGSAKQSPATSKAPPSLEITVATQRSTLHGDDPVSNIDADRCASEIESTDTYGNKPALLSLISSQQRSTEAVQTAQIGQNAKKAEGDPQDYHDGDMGTSNSNKNQRASYQDTTGDKNMDHRFDISTIEAKAMACTTVNSSSSSAKATLLSPASDDVNCTSRDDADSHTCDSKGENTYAQDGYLDTTPRKQHFEPAMTSMHEESIAFSFAAGTFMPAPPSDDVNSTSRDDVNSHTCAFNGENTYAHDGKALQAISHRQIEAASALMKGHQEVISEDFSISTATDDKSAITAKNICHLDTRLHKRPDPSSMDIHGNPTSGHRREDVAGGSTRGTHQDLLTRENSECDSPQRGRIASVIDLKTQNGELER
ncbi:MAG: hypothetical protein CMO35_06405, partial [Verrucomicrobiaceae bacterium]|nr:hypothetical protein [Verrucomicrobiaceae bacterium]